MKTFLVKVLAESDLKRFTELLQELSDQKVLEFREADKELDEPEEATEEQVQEIIDESEIGPYYSEDDAKKILHL